METERTQHKTTSKNKSQWQTDISIVEEEINNLNTTVDNIKKDISKPAQ